MKKDHNLRNWAILMLFWAMLSFNFFLIVFYQGRMAGDVYINTTLSNLADSLGSFAAGLCLVFVGIKNTFILSFTATAITCSLYLGSNIEDSNAWFAFILLMNKFFINVAFTTVFFSSSILFTPDVVSAIFASTHIGAKVLTIFSSILAQADGDAPMIEYLLSSCACVIAALFLVTNDK